MESFELPDGTIAESVEDIDKYLKRSGMAMSSDYSDGYRNRIRYEQERSERLDVFADLVTQYKKRIWYE